MQLKNHSMKKRLCGIALLFCFIFIYAEIPSGYYDDAEGKSGKDLKTALHNIIKGHRKLNYSNMPTYFRTTDWINGHYWDMYANAEHSTWNANHLNREHCMPKSWWSASPENTIAYSDLHNLYPSDYSTNTQKSNYPLGTTKGETLNNGVSKVGKNTFSGYNGEVFEPADEYKGDFARTYMYMTTCYENYSSDGSDGRWRDSRMLIVYGSESVYPTFNSYAMDLLMKWHREDPVSEKETNRNNAAYEWQENRNPFIDNPEFAELIWGDLLEGEESLPKNKFDISYIGEEIGKLIKVDVSRRADDTVYYEIYSVNGVRVQVATLPDNGEIQINELTSGMYILAVYSGNQRYTGRFIAISDR